FRCVVNTLCPQLDLHSCPTRRSSDLQIKNPLQTILLHAEMLEDGTLASDPIARQEICEAIVTEATRMTDLLADLSAYASGGQRRDRKSTRLNSSHVKISYAVFSLKKN